MNTKLYLIILASAFGLLIVGSIVGNMLESSGRFDSESLGPRGITALKIFFFTLFCIICYAAVPLLIKAFIVLQLKVGNGESFLVKFVQAHEQAVTYGFWAMCAIGICISLPAAIKEGFFK
jgi:hypothetical protein